MHIGAGGIVRVDCHRELLDRISEITLGGKSLSQCGRMTSRMKSDTFVQMKDGVCIQQSTCLCVCA